MANQGDGSLEERGPLIPHSLSAQTSTPDLISQESPPPIQRPGHARVPSVSINDEQIMSASASHENADATLQTPRSDTTLGLGIAMESEAGRQARRVSMQRMNPTPVMQQKSSTASLASPPPDSRLSGSTPIEASADFGADTSYGASRQAGKQSVYSLRSSIHPSLYPRSETDLLEVQNKYEDFHAGHSCEAHHRIKRKTFGSWLPITIMILAVFSSVFSFIYLILAIRGPMYGRRIYTHGSLTAGTAAFLTSFFAKLIELSFVTVTVAFIGQALARRAFKREDVRGVTLAEINMRNWVLQPGTIITHWHSVRYAGVSVLGLLALLAALNALLYTSAATALVQPQLKMPHWSPMVMHGLVKTEFANPVYIGGNCKTPITLVYDVEYRNTTCTDVNHASLSYYNWATYLSTWAERINNRTTTSDLSQRPQGYALINGNTSVIAPWVQQNNVATSDKLTGSLINNVSMALPHPGVVSAALDPMNDIMQPEELDGLGVYNVRASVPSPVVNVLCVTMNSDQLQPFIYDMWPEQNGSGPTDMTTWPTQLSTDYSNIYPYPYLGGTDFDDIFGWGPSYGDFKYPPVFPMAPANFNTILNGTDHMPYGRSTIYILGKGSPNDTANNPLSAENYGLCQLQVSWTADCSTAFNASKSGSTLEAICEDPSDKLRYIMSNASATGDNTTLSKDWPNVANEWARSLSLNTGVNAANASDSRLLTQLILPSTPGRPTALNPNLPSIAESLAVLAGETLLWAAQDAPINSTSWIYTTPIIDGDHQAFNASVQAQQYASGGTLPYQRAFYIILCLTFLMNVYMLMYFILHRDWYADFSEPTTLFSLAVNSPPSKDIACVGLQGNQYRVPWKLNSDGDHVYMESRDYAVDSPGLRRRTFTSLSEGLELITSPMRRATATFDQRRSRMSTP